MPPTSATTSVRGRAKRWLVDELTPLLEEDGVPVDSGWPGRRLELQHVWVDRVTGTQEYPLVMAGRKIRQDDFTVRVVFQAAMPGDDLATCDDRAEALFAHLENLVADDPSLDDLDSAADDVEAWVVAGIANVEGPLGELTDEGAVSWVIADVEFQSRLY